MSDEKSRPRQLGRGLSALLGEDAADYAALDQVRATKTVPIASLKPGRYQPRRRFAEEEIESLADSIRERGILQPLLVRRDPNDASSYEIVAGERRWRAAQLAQIHEVPVIIKDLTDSGALEVALIENVQRQDLNPLEEGAGYGRLIEEFGYTQEALGKIVGKSRSHVANTLRLLNLPALVRKLVEDGTLSAGHARALLNAEDPEGLARKVVSKGLNVRQTEKLVQRRREPEEAAPPAASKDADTIALERDLSNLLGLKVSVKFKSGGGELTIHYTTLDQLDEVLRRLSHSQAGPGAAALEPAH
jgi:ParB family chromosome partitioning protein